MKSINTRFADRLHTLKNKIDQNIEDELIGVHYTLKAECDKLQTLIDPIVNEMKELSMEGLKKEQEVIKSSFQSVNSSLNNITTDYNKNGRTLRQKTTVAINNIDNRLNNINAKMDSHITHCAINSQGGDELHFGVNEGGAPSGGPQESHSQSPTKQRSDDED